MESLDEMDWDDDQELEDRETASADGMNTERIKALVLALSPSIPVKATRLQLIERFVVLKQIKRTLEEDEDEGEGGAEPSNADVMKQMLKLQRTVKHTQPNHDFK